ncbi:CRISPR-associated helicase Cas3' [Pyrobaculum neutrophilum]|uniref:CRISPR-associated helicase Cas3 n=1 Tax=Pyrobaculum neutrophilum (strain DSM 2338 / JCM 9278 / NBRC 100436 / V24Sta) TaxID=444157 RepID=B1YDR6_PYRNV|nr:CRISPR-associated helicase Cas3' [Pyrobaculum neutrophilum]ACB39929.1 CRISPR-associated helicase Cas3 [Pyrobaculum neutrophilum V24Sta]
MRRAVERGLELARAGASRIVLELPTGYGKTYAAPLFYKALREGGLCSKAIHVMPLRALIRKQIERYASAHPDIKFAYQDGDVLLRDRYVKDPYFREEYVLTTLDSFIHNLAKVPVAEMWKFYKSERPSVRYHIPLAYIYPSCVFLDEAHMAAGSRKELAAVKAAVRFLKELGVPTVVMSATLGEWKRDVFKGFRFVSLGERDEERGGDVKVADPEFERRMSNVAYKVGRVDNIEEVARRKAEEGKRVLVIVNDVCRVQRLSETLGAPAVHSLMTRRDRERAERELDKAQIVVGTDAIGAGVDVDFDVLITEADEVERVAQRVGRVCRNRESCVGEIYFVGEVDEELLKVKNWRLPHKPDSYLRLLRGEAEVDEKHFWFLGTVMKEEVVDTHNLREKLLEEGGSFVRHALLEAEVGEGPEESFTVSLDRLGQLEFEVYVGERRIEPPRSYGDRELMEWLLDVVDEYGDVPRIRVVKYREGLGAVLKKCGEGV